MSGSVRYSSESENRLLAAEHDRLLIVRGNVHFEEAVRQVAVLDQNR